MARKDAAYLDASIAWVLNVESNSVRHQTAHAL
jgi:hypothetical protein